MEDLLQGTALQPWGETLGFGIHVVHQAVSNSKAAEFMGELDRSVANAAVNSARLNRAVEVKGGAAKPWYKTIQGTTGHCTCKYDFAGNARHEVYRVANVPALKSFENWVNDKHDVSPMYRVNEVLATSTHARMTSASIGMMTRTGCTKTLPTSCPCLWAHLASSVFSHAGMPQMTVYTKRLEATVVKGQPDVSRP